MNNTQEQVTITPELRLVLDICSGYVEAGIRHNWGQFGKRNHAVRFTVNGTMRAVSIMGFITAFHLAGNTKTANKLAYGFVRFLDHLCEKETMPSGYSYHGDVPKRLAELSDDGILHCFSVTWYVFDGVEKPSNMQDSTVKHYPLWYRPVQHGGAIFHGARHPETYNDEMGCMNLWSIHT